MISEAEYIIVWKKHTFFRCDSLWIDKALFTITCFY